MDVVLIRYIHFLGILFLFATLFSQNLLIRREVSIQQFKKIAVIDGIYGLSALVVLATGLLQWFAVGKPAVFYSSNPVFIAKVSIFILVGLLSIYPTVAFARKRKITENKIQIPKSIIMVIRIEMLLVIILPLLAILMARGYGSA